MIDIQNAFSAHGGEFITDYQVIIDKLNQIKVWLFDWDGVFNDGIKELIIYGLGIGSGTIRNFLCLSL
jgi:hypothetical protein